MQSQFSYHDDSLYVENVSLRDIALRYGTPCYVYSRAAVEDNWRRYAIALSGRRHQVFYAVKANSNLAVLGILARLGAGFDIVSGGELERVIRAGGNPAIVTFAGVGKTRAELRSALGAGIGCFNVESTSELHRLAQLATELDVQAPIALRLNPNVDPKTHPYIATGLHENKFGIPIDEAVTLARSVTTIPSLRLIGIGCHIGSQVRDLDAYRQSASQLMQVAASLMAEGIFIQNIDLGGGLAIPYGDQRRGAEGSLAIEDLIAAVTTLVDERYTLWLEPGRSIVGNAGLLLTEVLYLKHTPAKEFVIIDAAMTDLLRPALYDAWHEVIPVQQRGAAPRTLVDIVGPVCESGDFIGKARNLAVAEGDLLAVLDAGAYGFVMASAYNSRPRAAEVLVDGSDFMLVRARESVSDLMRGELTLRA